MSTQISDPSIVVNNVGVRVVPNTVGYTEGFGDQEVLVESGGNGDIEQVFSDNVETNIGMIKFSLRATTRNIELARGWKVNKNRNTITMTATTDDGTVNRTFAKAVLVNDYEVGLAADGTLELEFKSKAPTP